MQKEGKELFLEWREWILEFKNDKRAIKTRAYFQDQFDCIGVPQREMDTFGKGILSDSIFKDARQLISFVDTAWEFEREFLQFATKLVRKHIKAQSGQFINHLERWIQTYSWWDTVDALASQSVSVLFLEYEDQMRPIIYRWIESDHLWLNRSAIILQLKFKDQVDTQLLADAIWPHRNSKEFFHQKAIGWALRQYSKYNREWVKEFVNNVELSALSKREALKYI